MNDQAAITGQTNTYRALADGRIRITIDIDQEHRVAVAQAFGEVGLPVAIARLNAQTDREQRLASNAKTLYGDQARELKLSGFFRIPNVWQAIGTDEEFLAWLRTRDCAFKNLFVCDGDIVAAHVRRVANGAGTGIKPKVSAISMCSGHHMLQHNKGESALGGKEIFDRKRIEAVEQWAWDTLKSKLGYESFAEMPPIALTSWANERDLVKHLPACYVW